LLSILNIKKIKNLFEEWTLDFEDYNRLNFEMLRLYLSASSLLFVGD
jgi:hypothetical protein